MQYRTHIKLLLLYLAGTRLLQIIIDRQEQTPVPSSKAPAWRQPADIRKATIDGSKIDGADSGSPSGRLPGTPVQTPQRPFGAAGKVIEPDLAGNCRRALAKSTVQIRNTTQRGKREIGSGFYIDETIILTALHVIKNHETLTGNFPDGSSIPLIYVRKDKARDLALLRTASPKSGSEPLKIKTAPPPPGSRACLIGSPFGAPLRVMETTVKRVNDKGEVELKPGSLKPGDSGGPLLDQDGELIGLNRAVMKSRQGGKEGPGIAVNAAELKNFINQSAEENLMIKLRKEESSGITKMARLLTLLIILTCLLQSTAAFAGKNENSQAITQAKSTNKLYVVYIDLSSMNADQRERFATYLKTANLPRTAVGEKCIYYGRPQTWCLLLNYKDAAETFIKLKTESFGKTARVEPANRLGANN